MASYPRITIVSVLVLFTVNPILNPSVLLKLKVIYVSGKII